MKMKGDWKAYILFVFSFCPFTSSFYMNPKDHAPEIVANRYKYMEKYQLLGGKSHIRRKTFAAELIVCAITLKMLSPKDNRT